MKYFILTVILISGFIPYVSAAQLDATILFDEDTTKPTFEFLRVIYIEYPDGGEFSDLLRGKHHMISFYADNKTPGMNEFLIQLNQNLKLIPSNAFIADAKINYQVILQGTEDYAVVEYKLQLIPTITNHVFKQKFEKSIVDASWRGISLSEPIIIETKYGALDINNPKSALDVMTPNISENLKDISILQLPLVDASGIKELPLYRWHSLFDNTAIIPGAVKYNYTGENVITHYSMGECNIVIGLCDDREWIEDIDLDKKYTIRIIESRDDATISLEGYVDSTRIGDLEVFQISLKSSEPKKPGTGGFLTTTMYGMAGMAAIGGIVMFVFSNRKLKKDQNEGQTGIDPAHLRSYDTSVSAGSYKTNRGESYLISNEKSRMPI